MSGKVRKAQGKRPVGRVKRENGNFERYLIVRDTGCTGVNWIKLAQVIAQCLALMGTVVRLRVA